MLPVSSVSAFTGEYGKEYAMPVKTLVPPFLLALFGLLSVQNLPAQTASAPTAVIVGKVTDISTAEALGGVSARLLDGSGKVKALPIRTPRECSVSRCRLEVAEHLNLPEWAMLTKRFRSIA